MESCVLGYCKPDRRVYNECLHRLDVTPDQTIFLDDQTDNVEVARSIGITSIKVRLELLLQYSLFLLNLVLRLKNSTIYIVTQSVKLIKIRRIIFYMYHILRDTRKKKAIMMCRQLIASKLHGTWRK